jgi:hypothetical protein
MCSAPEDELSFTYVVGRDLQLRHTFSEGIATNHYHVPVTRNELARHLPALMPDIVDELGVAMEDEIPRNDGLPPFPSLSPPFSLYPELSNSSDWTPIRAFEATTKIVSRISNRVFVGLPLCMPLLPSLVNHRSK